MERRARSSVDRAILVQQRKEKDMKQDERNERSRQKSGERRGAPLIVPHGGAGAGRDFESAFDILRCDGIHELWRYRTAQRRRARMS
jgi:hypothetical protein